MDEKDAYGGGLDGQSKIAGQRALQREGPMADTTHTRKPKHS